MKTILTLLVIGYLTICGGVWLLLQLPEAHDLVRANADAGFSPMFTAFVGTPLMLGFLLTIVVVALIPVFIGVGAGLAASGVARAAGCDEKTAKVIGVAAGAITTYKLSGNGK